MQPTLRAFSPIEKRLNPTFTRTLAIGQGCVRCDRTFALPPPELAEKEPLRTPASPQGYMTSGCTCPDHEAVEIIYQAAASFDPNGLAPRPGLARYAPMLPTIVEELSMGEGGTPLIRYLSAEIPKGTEILIKDESQNPTWSHKDRLNLGVMSAVVQTRAPGVVAASTGNHGASAAAYAARAGRPCVLFCTACSPELMRFLEAYGALVVTVSSLEERWRATGYMVEKYGYHPVTNYSARPTNHPVGSEMYKSIAYELYLQLKGEAPAAVFVPVCFAELLYGVYKGFEDLRASGRIDAVPRLFSCETAARAPILKAINAEEYGCLIPEGERKASEAYSILSTGCNARGIKALATSKGCPIALEDAEMRVAQELLARNGIWCELSAAASFAGALRTISEPSWNGGRIVCISTSSGFKDLPPATGEPSGGSVKVESSFSIAGKGFDALDEILHRVGFV